MSSCKELLLDTLKLTDEVKRLNERTEKLSDKTMEIDKCLVRIETMIEVSSLGRLEKN